MNGGDFSIFEELRRGRKEFFLFAPVAVLFWTVNGTSSIFGSGLPPTSLRSPLSRRTLFQRVRVVHTSSVSSRSLETREPEQNRERDPRNSRIAFPSTSV